MARDVLGPIDVGKQRSFVLAVSFGLPGLFGAAALGLGCSDFPPITTDPAFASSPGSPYGGIGGPGLGNAGAAPGNPSLSQSTGSGAGGKTQNPAISPYPSTGTADPTKPAGPGGTGTGGAGSGMPAGAGSSRPMSSTMDVVGDDGANDDDAGDGQTQADEATP